MPIPTLASAADAQAFVDARIAEGSDYIKIVYDDGAAYGMRSPTLDRATSGGADRGREDARQARGRPRRLAHAARRRDRGRRQRLVHIFADAPADAAFVAARVAARRVRDPDAVA